MRDFRYSLFFFLVATYLLFAGISGAEVIRQGSKVTIVTPETVARLCPRPNCGEDQHIIRIPENTVLEVEGVTTVKTGRMSIKWFEVTYRGKRGWVSIYDTDSSDR